MLASRRTTINHMFAAAVAPHDIYDEALARSAMDVLGNDPDVDLVCAYCEAPAETWDHVFATVRDSRFSGYGHRLGNLLPCCKPCNSRKGNKPWEAYLSSVPASEAQTQIRRDRIIRYLAAYSQKEPQVVVSDDTRRLEQIRTEILSLIEDADEIAARIRTRLA